MVRANFLNSFPIKTGRKAVYTAWLHVNVISDCDSKRIFKLEISRHFLKLRCLVLHIHTYIHKEYLYSAKEQKSHNAPRSQLQASPNKYVFSFCLKAGNVRFGRRSSAGSSFHNLGPAAVKLMSPNRLCVAGTDSIRMSLEPERSGRRPISDSRRRCVLDRLHAAQ